MGVMRTSRGISRRAVLRGAGVALTLPWLESLARPARAQAAAKRPQRFVAVFIPNGAPDIWMPPVAGKGDAWRLSSVLEPLTPLKSRVTVISGLENGSPFNESGSFSVEPSHGRLPGGWLTCVDGAEVKKRLNVPDANGVSVDQVMAAHPKFAGQTALPSLQIGLSTVHSYCDGVSCSYSRSVSWRTETEPLYKIVDPTALFDRLVGATPGGNVGAARREARLSVLDAVKETAGATRGRLSAADRLRLDEFLSSVRGVEQRVDSGICPVSPIKPSFPRVLDDGIKQDTYTYNRSTHFDLMNELLAIALQCDHTRIASYMMEDERSEFVFNHVPRRAFTTFTSEQIEGFCPEWHGGGQNGSVNDFATIVHWHIGKLAAFCERLRKMDDGDGQSVLDNTVVFIGCAMHGMDHSARNLPTVTIGGGGGALATDQHLALTDRPLRDFYFTLMNSVYGMGVTDFGVNKTGAPIAPISELLA